VAAGSTSNLQGGLRAEGDGANSPAAAGEVLRPGDPSSFDRKTDDSGGARACEDRRYSGLGVEETDDVRASRGM
jgi:hypothetical protein